MTGLQYSVGRAKDQQQFANLTDPVEYNTMENKPLMGTPQNAMSILSNSLSLYFGATFNFGGGKQDQEIKPLVLVNFKSKINNGVLSLCIRE